MLRFSRFTPLTRALVLLFGGLALAAMPRLQAGQVPISWGTNSFGQLGNGTKSTTSLPVAAELSGEVGGRSFTEIAGGVNFSVGLTEDGRLFAWGDNSSGQLGSGALFSGTEATTPTAVDMTGVLAGKTVKAVAAGRAGAIALTTEGKLYTWGDNSQGQLGNGGSTTATAPVAVDMTGALAGKTVTAVAGAAQNFYVLTSDGRVYSWGNNLYVQIGSGGVDTLYRTPQAVSFSGALAGKTVTALASGSSHVLVLTSDNRLYVWGNGLFGQHGNGTATLVAEPTSVDMSGVLAGQTIARIACGEFSCLVTTTEGRAYAWGYYDQVQQGDYNTPDSWKTPARIDNRGALNGESVVQLAGGSGYTLALAASGKLYAWGNNRSLALGVPLSAVATRSDLPVAVDASGALQGLRVTALPRSASGYGQFHAVVLAEPATTPVQGLINVSIRGPVGPGEEGLIAGFVMQGSISKPIVLRGIGPALRAYGLNEAAVDPTLAVYLGPTVIGSNDNWSGTTELANTFTRVGAFALPVGSKDSATQLTLTPGAYTNVVSAAGGVALVEVYDAEISDGRTRMINVSGRGARIGVGENTLIAGFYLDGGSPVRVLIRAVGPTLSRFGVSTPLANPTVTVYDAAGRALATNDNWSGDATLADNARRAGAFDIPVGSKDAALELTLSPGAYTAVVSSADGSIGIALVEVYAL